MRSFISSLLNHCWEDPAAYHDDPQYQADLDTVSALETKISQTMGWDFLSEYERAANRFHEWEHRESFRCGIQFGMSFVLEVFGQSSASAPKRRRAAEISSQP